LFGRRSRRPRAAAFALAVIALALACPDGASAARRRGAGGAAAPFGRARRRAAAKSSARAPARVPGSERLPLGGGIVSIALPRISTPEPAPLAGRVVVLDPGHGGSASGAVAPHGLRESDLNLDVARELAGLLTGSGVTVVLTRVGDTDCLIQPRFVLREDLVARARLSNHLGADLFLSCHHNDAPRKLRSSAVARQNRTEVYYRMDDEGPSRSFGARVFEGLSPILRNRRSELIPGAFAVLRYNEQPAVLGEPFYMTSLAQERIARGTDWARTEAGRYLEGVLAYLKVARPAPRFVRPVDGEVVDRATFPAIIEAAAGSSTGTTLVVTAAGVPVQEVSAAGGVPGRASTRPSGGWLASLARVPNGPVLLEASLQAADGGFSPIARRRFRMQVPPSRLEVLAWPESVPEAYRGPVMLRARVLDHRELPVADGTRVRASLPSGRVVTGETAGGEADLIVAPAGRELRVQSGAVSRAVTLPATGPLLVAVHGRVRDARTGRPVPWAVVAAVAPVAPAAPAATAAAAAAAAASAGAKSEVAVRGVVHRGNGQYLVVGRGPLFVLRASADGYLARTSDPVTATATGAPLDIALEPVLAGAFRGHSVVFDAEPGPHAAALLANLCALFVGTGIGGVHATWPGTGRAREQDRARAANRTTADVAITVMHATGVRVGGPVKVHYYHASERGKAIAEALAGAFRKCTPPMAASIVGGGSYFLNNTRATTIGLAFGGGGRRGGSLSQEGLAYVLLHGLMRAFAPDLPPGKTVAGTVPAGASRPGWVIVDTGDRCHVGADGGFTLLDAWPGRHTAWYQPVAAVPEQAVVFTLDVP
jgi:N-acetylmuramoyl-L-alanine amidase